jgi:hypothetical protein
LTLCLKNFTGPHDAENLSAYLQYCFDKYKIGNKIISICADNAGDIQNGLKLLQQEGKTHFTGRCMGHWLQLVVKRVIDVVKAVTTKTGKIKASIQDVLYFKNNFDFILKEITKKNGFFNK